MRCGIPLGHANQPQLTTSRDCKALLVTSHYNVISEVYANDSKQGGGLANGDALWCKCRLLLDQFRQSVCLEHLEHCENGEI